MTNDMRLSYGVPQQGHPGQFQVLPPGYSMNLPAGNPVPPQSAPRLAGWGRRVAASLLDLLADGGPVIIGYGIAMATMIATGETTTDAYGRTSLEPSTPFGVVVTVVSILGGWGTGFGVWLWNRVFRQGRTGQSIGKKWLRIRLVSASNGQPPGAGVAFGRDVAHYLDGILYLGYLWPLWDKNKQTFADKICSTVVVMDDETQEALPVPR